jgi:hypothetical protein
MIVGTMIWVLMPIGVALDAGLSRGIGVYLFGVESPVVVTVALLPWLTPLCLVTTGSGLLVYFGRVIRPGLAVACGWFVIGLVAAPGVAVIAGLVVYCLHTGERRLAASAT